MLVLVLGRCFGSAIRDVKKNYKYQQNEQTVSIKSSGNRCVSPQTYCRHGNWPRWRNWDAEQRQGAELQAVRPQGHDPAVHPPARVTSTGTPSCGTPSGEDHVHRDTTLRYTLRRRSRPQGHHPAVHPPAKITSTGSPSCGTPAGEDHVHRDSPGFCYLGIFPWLITPHNKVAPGASGKSPGSAT